MLMKKTRLVLICGIIAAAVTAAQAQFEMPSHTIDGGSASSTGGSYELTGTSGQSDAGFVAGGNYALTGGFWNAGIVGSNCASIDDDNDGFDSCTDCDDSNELVFPGNLEFICDGIDNDCDPVTEDNPNNACSVQSPTMVAEGPRYLAITPAPGDIPVALRFQYFNALCAYGYVDIDPNPPNPEENLAILVDVPVYRLPEEWGTVHLRGQEIVPGEPYVVRALVGGAGEVADFIDAQTFAYGDVDDNGVANFADILTVVQGFQDDYDSIGAVDLAPCRPNGVVNFEDILTSVLAFQQNSYGDLCNPSPCQCDPSPCE